MFRQEKKRHWLVLLSVLLSLFFGIYFQPKYKVTPGEIRQLESDTASRKISPEAAAQALLFARQEVGNDATNKEDFLETLQAYMPSSDKEAVQYILKICEYNPPVTIVATIGEIYLRILLILSLPFLFFSVSFGIIQSGNTSNAGRIHLKMIIYAFGSTFAALLIGIVFAGWIFPRSEIRSEFADLKQISEYTEHQLDTLFYDTFSLKLIYNIFENHWILLLIAAGVTGIFILKLSTKNRNTLSDFLRAGFELVQKITEFVIHLAPIGIFGLLVPVVANTRLSLQNTNNEIPYIFIGIISALFFYAFVFLPALLYFGSKTKPSQFFKEQLTPLLVAFASADIKAAVAPAVTVLKEQGKIPDKEVSSTLPLAMIVNMSGTALFSAMAVIFMARIHRFDLEFGELIIIAIITPAVSMSGLGIFPFPVLIISSISAKVLNLPPEGLVFLLPFERLLQMFSSAIDLWSGICGVSIIASSEN
ncbi:MAG: hypothetical protein CSB06_03345 [Bacteroidia bacterium]|nr:MAG: hypothetical protein CSB06_03345 [Bacteroidia bacterium]